MSDLDARLRATLHERARDLEPTAAASPRVLQRARARQLRSAVLSIVGVTGALALVALGIGRFTKTDDHRSANRDVASLEATIDGVQISYPADWYLFRSQPITYNWPNPPDHGQTLATRPVLQLTNVDPGHWVCPLPSGSFPDHGVLLYVQAVSRSLGDTPAPWPVGPPGEGPAPFAGCATFVAAEWTAGGVTYQGFLAGTGPDYDRLLAIFRGLRFQRGTPPVPGEVAPGPGWRLGDAFVVASGPASDPWLVLATRDGQGRLCLTRIEGSDVMTRCDLDVGPPEETVVRQFDLTGGSRGAFGIAGDGVASIEVRPDDGTTSLSPVRRLPTSLGGGLAFGVGFGQARSGTLAALDDSGARLTVIRFPTDR